MNSLQKKIAIFRALQLGDMLCIIPAVRAVKTALPSDVSITLIGLPGQRAFATRFRHYFSSFIEFPGWPGLPEQSFEPKVAAEFLLRMQKEQYELVLQMQGNGAIANAMCSLWGAGKLAGLRRSGEYSVNEKLFPVSEDKEHEVLRFLKLTDVLGFPRAGEHLEFPFLEGELEYFYRMANRLKLFDRPYVCLHPGARDAKRRWSPENFAIVGDQLAKDGYNVVLTGSEAERELLWDVQSFMRYPAINTIGILPEFPLGHLAAFIAHGSLLVSNDTGVSHIAAALQVPSVIIFSPYSDPKRWAPLNNSLHLPVSFDEAERPEFVIHCAHDQLEKFAGKKKVVSLFSKE